MVMPSGKGRNPPQRLLYIRHLMGRETEEDPKAWWCTVETKMTGMCKNWNEIRKMAEDHQQWRNIAAVICATGNDGSN